MTGLIVSVVCPACRERIAFSVAEMEPEELLAIYCPQCSYTIYKETECEEWTYDRT